MNYQINYKDAERLCAAYDNFNFYKTLHRIDGYTIATFNYFLCEYKHFDKPLDDSPEIKGHDMRGVTFVFDKDALGNDVNPKRFLMLKKFFNVNQVPETQLDLIKKKKIKHITSKEDGSLVTFMHLPNGKVFTKTQAGFTNEQSAAALNLYHSQKDIKKFVDMSLIRGFTPLFEYVSYDNRIVLKYSTKELRLIGMRDNEDGEFYSAASMTKLKENFDIPSVTTLPTMTFEELEHLVHTAEDMEGVVVEFEDGQLVKWKTTWYFNLHGIRTVNIFREDYVIKNYLKETLDDAMQELNMTDDADAFRFVDKVKGAVTNWSAFIDKKTDELAELYKTYEKWGTFAFENRKAPFFSLGRTKIETPENYKSRKIDFMLKQTYHLNEAKFIVEKWQKHGND